MASPAYKAAKVADLIPYARNSRTHSDAQVTKIAASIKEFGFLNPVIVDGQNGIIAGHGRVMAAKKLGLEEVPVIEASHLSEAQRRAYVIADNRLALDSEWDEEMLSLELEDLHSVGFNMDLLGFDAPELSLAMGLEEHIDGAAPSPEKPFDYQEKFAVLVDCEDEAHQHQCFEKLTSMGFDCKVLVN